MASGYSGLFLAYYFEAVTQHFRKVVRFKSAYVFAILPGLFPLPLQLPVPFSFTTDRTSLPRSCSGGGDRRLRRIRRLRTRRLRWIRWIRRSRWIRRLRRTRWLRRLRVPSRRQSVALRIPRQASVLRSRIRRLRPWWIRRWIRLPRLRLSISSPYASSTCLHWSIQDRSTIHQKRQPGRLQAKPNELWLRNCCTCDLYIKSALAKTNDKPLLDAGV